MKSRSRSVVNTTMESQSNDSFNWKNSNSNSNSNGNTNGNSDTNTQSHKIDHVDCDKREYDAILNRSVVDSSVSMNFSQRLPQSTLLQLQNAFTQHNNGLLAETVNQPDSDSDYDIDLDFGNKKDSNANTNNTGESKSKKDNVITDKNGKWWSKCNSSGGNIGAIEMSQSQLSGKSSSKSGNNANTNTSSTDATSVSSLSLSDNVLKICVMYSQIVCRQPFFLVVKRYSQTKVWC